MSYHRFKNGDSLVVASHNPGKVIEIGMLIEPYGIRAISAGELDLEEPEETGKTFEDNAKLKALFAAIASGQPALADDSGLEVEALDGQPGIYSARWAGPDRDFSLAMERVQQALEENGALSFKERRANFICVLCLAFPDGHVQLFEGKVYGHLVWPPRGTKGFGYDPMFQPDGYDQTFGEFDPMKKHRMSHRARAFEKFVKECFESDAA